MNASIDTTAAETSTANRRHTYVVLALSVVLAAGIGLVQWTFASDFGRSIDWAQTAFVLYMITIGTIGSLLILPSLIANAGKPA